MQRSADIHTRQLGLGTWLALAFTALSLLLTVSLTLFSDRAASNQVRASIGDNLAELAQQTTSRLDRAMFERHREVRLIAQRLGGQTDPAVVRQTVESVQKSYPYYAWIGVTDAAGTVRTATRGVLEGVDVSTRPWFRNAIAIDQSLGHVHDAALLNPLQGTQGSEPQRFVDIAFPLTDATNQITGVLGVQLSWNWASDIQDAIFASVNQHRQVEMLIFSTNGTVLLGPQALQGTTLQLPSLEAAARGEAGYSKEVWPDGKTYLVGYSRDNGFDVYPGLQWRVLVRQSLREAYAPVDGLHKRMLIGGLVAAVLFSLLGWLIARTITRPLLNLTDVARGIEAGYAVKAPTRAPYREVALLGNAFNSLVKSLQDKESELRMTYAAQERRVSERTAELREAFHDVRANEERVQTVIDTAQEAFIGMDFEGRITDWNAEAEKLFGWDRFEVLGESLADTVLPERFQSAFVQALTGFLITGKAPFTGHRMRRTVVNRNGVEMEVDMKISLINTGDIQLFSAFVRPVSDLPPSEAAG
ncbi:cache domain-containing protein [Hydrogenophaga sp.]|uniref:cache domain-containing protein n=1 Tax=Hydrogenophaga sp. TaxID=1904254 RepID=UPI00271EDA5F|nr:cache domain-containing protein [Hydrogenophaga sp.]MDO9435137.1 cache domain-containing protein [Hydrogenophaga sp.]